LTHLHQSVSIKTQLWKILWSETGWYIRTEFRWSY